MAAGCKAGCKESIAGCGAMFKDCCKPKKTKHWNDGMVSTLR